MKHNHLLFSAFLFVALLFTPNVWADAPYLVENALITQDNNEARNAYLTFSTEEDGSILITISEYGTNGTTSFRGNGMSKEGFTYNDGSGDVDIRNYFNLRYIENSTEYRWVPISKALVRCGATIKYNTAHNRQIEWYAGSQSPNSNQFDFTYTYGANSTTETGVGCYDSYPANTSEYCNATICQNNNNNENNMAYITWETNGNGDVVITLSDYGNASNTRFRSNGMAWDGFELKNGDDYISIGTYFDRVYTNGETTYTLEKKTAIPSGAKIVFNRNKNKNIEWYVGSNSPSDARYCFEYTYGTSCPSMEAPVISGIDASKHITFSTSTGAEQYNLAVYRGENNLVYSKDNISSGDVIDFVPFVNATYSVYVTAIAEGLQPAVSEVYNWVLTASSDPKPLSLVCDMTVNEETDNNVYITAETDLDGKIIFTLTGATWRGGAIQFDQFRVGNSLLNTYFDKQNENGSGGYAGTYTLTLTPKANQTGVLLGDQIRYSGNVEWNRTAASGNNYKNVTFNYVYGTKCTTTLPTPSITAIDENQRITYTESAGATHYTVFVYNGEDLVYTQENVTNNAVINFAPYLTATYTVKMTAYDDEDRSSNPSTGYSWALTGNLANLPASNVCNQLLRQGSDASSEVYISIETDDADGSFYITMQPDNAAFRDNEYIVESGLKYDGQALTSYFTRSFLDQIANQKPRTIKYTPINRNNVQYGKNITFNKNSEAVQLAWWTNTSSSHNSNQLSFTYIYGTKCELSDAFEHSNSVSLYANHPDDNLTVNEAMTINGNGHTIGNITVQTAGALTVGSALTANKLLVEAKPGASGQVIDANNLTVTEAWTSQQLLPDEAELKPATDWYCFTVPFEVSLTDGVYTNAGVKLNSGSDYLIYRYDGEQRAATGRGWVKATENLSAGVAYLIGFKNSETAKTFRFKKATSGTLAEPNSITMVAHSSSNAADADWNAVGNPSLRHINITPDTKVQVLNNASQTFAPYQTGEKSFVVGSPFFAQGTSTLTLGAASYSLLAPALAPAQRMEACVEIYKEGRAWLDDRLYVAADEAATAEWQQGRDLPTLNTTSDRVALMHTAHYGMKLAAVELPWAEQVDYNLVLTAPTNGTYNLHTASVTDGTMVLLTKDGRPVWDLTVGDYALPLTEGTDTSYGLRLIQMAPQVPTDVMNTAAENRHRKVLNRGQLYILRDGRWYNAVGQSIY